MLVDLFESQTFLVKILLKFKTYLRRVKSVLGIEVVNSYNGLYLSDLDNNRLGLIVIKPEGFDCLEPRSLRSGNFYQNVNEFGLKFTLHFLGFVRDIGELKTYENVYKVYEYFLDFLNLNLCKFEFKKQVDSDYEITLSYYIKAREDLVNGGFVKVSYIGLRSVFGLIQPFRANIQAIEIKN